MTRPPWEGNPYDDDERPRETDPGPGLPPGVDLPDEGEPAVDGEVVRDVAINVLRKRIQICQSEGAVERAEGLRDAIEAVGKAYRRKAMHAQDAAQEVDQA